MLKNTTSYAGLIAFICTLLSYSDVFVFTLELEAGKVEQVKVSPALFYIYFSQGIESAQRFSSPVGWAQNSTPGRRHCTGILIRRPSGLMPSL